MPLVSFSLNPACNDFVHLVWVWKDWWYFLSSNVIHACRQLTLLSWREPKIFLLLLRKLSLWLEGYQTIPVSKLLFWVVMRLRYNYSAIYASLADTLNPTKTIGAPSLSHSLIIALPLFIAMTILIRISTPLSQLPCQNVISIWTSS